VTSKKSIKQGIQDWYQGTYVPPPSNDTNSRIVFIGLGHYEQPLLAKMLRRLSEFWSKYWQWIIGTILTVIGIIASLK
jgi:hypothetical protein